MKKLERFIPQTPDPYLKQADQLGAVKFGHINALVDAINSTIYGDYLQLEGDGPMSTTLRALEDPEGNKAKLFLATDQTKIEGLLTITDTLSIEGRLELKADPTATTQTTAVIQATDTNSGIAIVPNGTGAITAQVPDGTATGGNARGQYAVDLQRVRTFNGNIASGISSLVFGYDNRASGNYSFAGGNYRNYALGEYSFAFGNQSNANKLGAISIGQSNTADGENSIAMGRECSATGGQSVSLGFLNTSSSAKSTISGGGSNTASTNTYATVVGGYQNSSTGQYSISGGYSNVASGLGSVALGYNNTASGSYAVSLGLNNVVSGINCFCMGSNNTVSGNNNIVNGILNTDILGQLSIINGRENKTTSGHSYGIVSGYKGKGYLHNQMVHSNEGFDIGECQVSSVVARNNTTTFTTGQTTSLFIDYLGKKIIPDGNNRVWNVKVETVAVVTSITGTATGVSVGDSLLQNDVILFSKIGGTSSVVGTNNTQFISSTSLSTALMVYSAGASQELALTFTAPNFTGGGSVTMRVVSKVSLVEVAY